MATQDAELLAEAQPEEELKGEAEPVPTWDGLAEVLPLPDRAAVAEGEKDWDTVRVAESWVLALTLLLTDASEEAVPLGDTEVLADAQPLAVALGAAELLAVPTLLEVKQADSVPSVERDGLLEWLGSADWDALLLRL